MPIGITFYAIFSAFEDGLIFAIMALGVYISFRILDFPDLTVDGSFVTGASVAATLIVLNVNPIIATLLAIIIGFIVGSLTGMLHAIGKINALLSGILMMIGLYSINFRIMGDKPNVSLLKKKTLFTSIEEFLKPIGIDKFLKNLWSNLGLGDSVPSTFTIMIFMILLVIVVKMILDKFLRTEIGLAVRATGDNKKMIRSLSANTNLLIILGLGISNALVSFAGGLFAQSGMSSSLSLGSGMIIFGLASVIIGEVFAFGKTNIPRMTIAVIIGAVLYKLIIAWAMDSEFLTPNDTKLITASIVLVALIAPKIFEHFKNKKLKEKRIENHKNNASVSLDGGGAKNAPVKENI